MNKQHGSQYHHLDCYFYVMQNVGMHTLSCNSPHTAEGVDFLFLEHLENKSINNLFTKMIEIDVEF